MNVAYLVLPSLLMVLATGVAVAPWGVRPVASIALQLLPYFIAHLFIVRGRGVVPSPVVFAAGLAIDIGTDGPLGFWALIYLTGVLIARQLPAVLLQSRFGRLSGLFLIVAALTATQVGIASLYQLQWIDWQVVLAGTALAGIAAAVLDLLWRGGRSERDLNVTERGAGRATASGSGHV